ncbi:MAG: PhzF family phenazine biosynthesis protein [Methylococcales bacterium]
MGCSNKLVVHTSVFVDGPDGGNACPVVIDGSDITSDQGCHLAQQFGAETIIVGKSKNPELAFSLRYFVPLYEMEMCVHGTIAAVTALLRRNLITTSPVGIETTLGEISVEWKEEKGGIQVTVYQFLPEFSKNNPTVDEVASALRVPLNFINSTNWPIASISTSRYKLIVPLITEKILNEVEPDYDALWEICDKYNITGFYPFSGESGFYTARQFPKRVGYNEDPATGVAASALGAYLATYGESTNGWNIFHIRQGYAMKRPSLLSARILIKDGSIIRTSVVGKAIIHNESIEKIQNII